ncbi:homeobox-leucine zipper protein HAT9-like isoform X2 [Typha angustifolia]|uniref:homeobox-leucine zipper protein HAT9-like isoform X2 n=1 Tax=Typha angustifolia TaxID=59011 RepID=UPI003C2EFBCD
MDMGQDDVCDTGLALCLAIGGKRSRSTDGNQRLKPCSSMRDNPSLSLSLRADDSNVDAGRTVPKTEATNKVREEVRAAQVSISSSRSAVSSFCAYPTNVKREKDMGGEDTEVEKGSSRASDEEEDGSARKKLRLTKEQSALLEERFKEHSTLNPKQKQALAKQLNLRPRQVEVWFQNRRARTKLKQTEVDCEFLKRCCETLTDENQRLHKELQELKAIKFDQPPPPPPCYMHFSPVAAVTMCPSCEKISGEADGSKGRPGPFVVAPPSKPYLFNPFTRSAAC